MRATSPSEPEPEGPATSPCATPRTPRAPIAIGPFAFDEVIGDAFVISRVLGVGGMGVVYEARDDRLHRLVAIKAPRYPEFTASLRAEAQVLAALHSPGFATVHCSGEHHGTAYFVMERLFGESLEARLHGIPKRSEPLALTEVIDILIPIADALTAAHAIGVTLRDLKPSNVILCGERVVLIDLGISVPEVLIDEQQIPGGSIEYIAPEVLLRDVQPGEGPLVDLYAFGVLAYELLTHETPFAADSPQRTLANHICAPVPDVRDVRADVPHELAALVRETLAKEPKQRPPSAEAVLWQLKDVRHTLERRSQRMTVLAIDAEPETARSLKRSLESAFPQVHVETTTSPSQVKRHSSRPPADVVLVALDMPRHSGLEICMDLLALPPERRPVVVATSERVSLDDLDVLREVGIRHFVPKDHRFLGAMSDVIRDLRMGRPSRLPAR